MEHIKQIYVFNRVLSKTFFLQFWETETCQVFKECGQHAVGIRLAKVSALATTICTKVRIILQCLGQLQTFQRQTHLGQVFFTDI
jgi:hypothetical protein